MPPARHPPADSRLDSVVALAREPVILLTPDRKITLVNRGWEELTGHPEREVIGLECRPHGPTRAGDLAGLGGSFCPPSEAMAGEAAGGRTLIIRRGGERIERRLEFWPFHDATGQLTGLLGIVRGLESRPLVPDAASQSLRTELLEIRGRMYARHEHDALVGRGSEHQRVLDGVDLAAASTVPVTIVGDSGTGKRFVARLIHQRGPRRLMPLLGYDCRAIPTAILERELFGGTANDRDDVPGRFVAPDGSTIVLGDVLALPRDLQARLAANLGVATRSVRLIATTAGDLEQARRDEQLRPDLYHALTTLVIRLRPLRDRLDEVPLLAQSLLERANLRGAVARSGFHPTALAALRAYDWPRNLRELAEVIDRAHATAAGDLITVDDLSAEIRGQRGGAYLPVTTPAVVLPLRERLLAVERAWIEEALAQVGQNKTRAARRLGVNRPFLYRRIRELGIADLDGAGGEAEDSSGLDRTGPGPSGDD